MQPRTVVLRRRLAVSVFPIPVQGSRPSPLLKRSSNEQEFSVEGYAVPFCSGKPKSLRGDGRRNSSGQDHRDLVRGAFGRDRAAFVFSLFSRPFRLRLFFRNFFSSFLLSAEVEGPLLLQYFSFFSFGADRTLLRVALNRRRARDQVAVQISKVSFF